MLALCLPQLVAISLVRSTSPTPHLGWGSWTGAGAAVSEPSSGNLIPDA